MLVDEISVLDIEKEIKSKCNVTQHCLHRIKQRLGMIPFESFLFDFNIAYEKYRKKSKDVKKKKKLRLNSKGLVYRNEYFVKSHGITFVFYKGTLITVYIELR